MMCFSESDPFLKGHYCIWYTAGKSMPIVTQDEKTELLFSFLMAPDILYLQSNHTE